MFDQRERRELEKRMKEQQRLPPGQSATIKFPVLHYGPVPRVDLARWEFRVFGLVAEERRWSWEEFNQLPRSQVTLDIHCVTRWSKLDTNWVGVRFSDFLAAVEIRCGKLSEKVGHVMQHSTGGYTTNTSLATLMDEDVLITHTYDGAPLAAEHGGPVRMLVPKYYFWKSAKWLNGFEFLERDQRGFWERYGYHMHGDPWTEERFG